MTTEYTTLDVARRMTEVADALTAYGHLPALARVSVGAADDARVYLHLPYSLRHTESLVSLCAWAAAFGADVTITLSYNGSGEVNTDFCLAGRQVRMYETLHSGQAYELGAALRRPISTDRPEIQVTPAELLTAIDGGSGDG
jgi:hypothetical protein